MTQLRFCGDCRGVAAHDSLAFMSDTAIVGGDVDGNVWLWELSPTSGDLVSPQQMHRWVTTPSMQGMSVASLAFVPPPPHSTSQHPGGIAVAVAANVVLLDRQTGRKVHQ